MLDETNNWEVGAMWWYGRGFGFRGFSPPWPFVGIGRGGLPRCWYYAYPYWYYPPYWYDPWYYDPWYWW